MVVLMVIYHIIFAKWLVLMVIYHKILPKVWFNRWWFYHGRIRKKSSKKQPRVLWVWCSPLRLSTVTTVVPFMKKRKITTKINASSVKFGVLVWKLLNLLKFSIWMFPKIGVPQNGWMIWGYHHFRKPPYRSSTGWGDPPVLIDSRGVLVLERRYWQQKVPQDHEHHLMRTTSFNGVLRAIDGQPLKTGRLGYYQVNNSWVKYDGSPWSYVFTYICVIYLFHLFNKQWQALASNFDFGIRSTNLFGILLLATANWVTLPKTDSKFAPWK